MEIEPGRWDYSELTRDEIAELNTTFAARAFALYNEWKTFLMAEARWMNGGRYSRPSSSSRKRPTLGIDGKWRRRKRKPRNTRLF